MTENPNAGLSRRTVMTAVAIGAACGAMVYPHPADAKMSQKASLYQDTPKGDQRCANCTLFQPPSACKLVDGNVSPDGWCKLFVLKH